MRRRPLTTFSQWYIPVCALFKGRVVDRPEHPMPSTPETSGGSVEHEVYMTEGILLIVIELNLYFKDLRDHIAQVLLELDCKCHIYVILDDMLKCLSQRPTESIASSNSPTNLPFMVS